VSEITGTKRKEDVRRRTRRFESSNCELRWVTNAFHLTLLATLSTKVVWRCSTLVTGEKNKSGAQIIIVFEG